MAAVVVQLGLGVPSQAPLAQTVPKCQVLLCGAVLMRRHTSSVVVSFGRSAEELQIDASKSSLGNLEMCEERSKAGVVLWQQHVLSAEYRGA